jgi:hypothetical protein
MIARAVEILHIDQLKPWPRNARTHSRKQVRQIAESIRRFGFTNPVLIDGENRMSAETGLSPKCLGPFEHASHHIRNGYGHARRSIEAAALDVCR